VCVAVVALSLAIFNCYVLLLLSLSIVKLRLSTSNKVYDDGNAVEQYLVYSIHDQVIGTIKRNECFTSWVRIRSPVGMPLSRDTSVMKFSCRSDQFFSKDVNKIIENELWPVRREQTNTRTDDFE